MLPVDEVYHDSLGDVLPQPLAYGHDASLLQSPVPHGRACPVELLLREQPDDVHVPGEVNRLAFLARMNHGSITKYHRTGSGENHAK